MENGEENYSTNVEFNEGYQTNSSVSSNTPKMICWVIDYSGGLVKDERGASYVLFGVVVVAIIVSFFLFFGGGRDIKLSPEEERLINNINFSDKSSRTHQVDEQIFNQ